jgi:hypothetical protein
MTPLGHYLPVASRAQLSGYRTVTQAPHYRHAAGLLTSLEIRKHILTCAPATPQRGS